MEKIENYWKILSEVNDAIKFAEAKAIAIISTSGILTAFLFSKQDLSPHLGNCFFFTLFVLCVVSIFSTIFFSLLCLKPNFSNESKGSMFYFNSILDSKATVSEFDAEIAKVLSSEKELSCQLSEQIITKSRIARRKYRHVNYSIFSFIVYISVLLTLMILS